MINISILSLSPNETLDLEKVTESVNSQFHSINCKLTVHYNQTDDSYRLCIAYNHPVLPKEKSFTTLDTSKTMSLYVAIHQILSDHLTQLLCQHEYERPTDRFGVVMEDGRGVCKKCSFKHPEALPAGDNKVISMSSLGEESGDVSSQFPWPASCYLQGGDKGIVLRKKNSYRTSFCEGFLSIHGIKTFIRGEGVDIREAEKDCFGKYQKMNTCRNHEFSREVRGSTRRDGYAICIHCGLSGSVLPPLDRCIECDTPTNEKIGSTPYCTTHWLAQGFDKILKERIEGNKSCSILGRISDDEAAFDLYVEMELKSFWLQELGQEKLDDLWSRLTTTKVYFKDSLLRRYFGKKGFSMSSGFPSSDNHVLKENLDHYKRNKDKILEFVNEEGSLNTSDLVIL